MMKEFNCQRKIDESNGIEYNNDDNDRPDYRKLKKKHLMNYSS